MAELFGFEIVRKKDAEEKAQPDRLVTFAPEIKDDGAVVVAEGGVFGTYLDLEGSARTESDLVAKYREMSLQPEVESAIDDIVNEFVSYDSEQKLVDIVLDDLEFGNKVKDKIRDEFNTILQMLDFNNSGYEIVRRWYIDGRLYYHAIIDVQNPREGIQEIRYIDPRKIRKIREIKRVRRNSQASTAGQQVHTTETKQEYYMYSERGFSGGTRAGVSTTSYQPAAAGSTGIRIATDSIVHVTSGLMDASNQMVLSYLHKAIKPLNQLRTLEDATVIYRISRAPERRIFYIDVGNLPKIKAEQYLRDMMVRHKNRLVYDATTGDIRDDRKFMTMLEDFWLPRREGGKGTEITTLPGGQNLGEIEDVLYFQKKMYKSLGVPISRLESEGGFNLGRAAEITRDELKFGKFINRMRMRFSNLFKETLKKQLILKGIISEEESLEIFSKIRFDFMRDGYFTELKEAEVLTNRLTLAQQMEPYIGKYFSHQYMRTKVLHQSEEEIEQIDKELLDEHQADMKLQQAQIDAGMSSNPLAAANAGQQEQDEESAPQQ
jgi:hypothetical protein